MFLNRAVLRRYLTLMYGMVLVAVVGVVATPAVLACPFCSAVSLTFSEEMGASDVVVIAKIVERPPQTDGAAVATTDESMSGFEIVHVLRGEDKLGDTKKFKAFYFGEDPTDTHFLLMGTAQPDLAWSTPITLNETTEQYMLKLPGLPEKGVERLAFFQEYFEDQEDLLARDAYDEFAKAPYSELRLLADQMHHDQLLSWIGDANVTTTHRRLYLTMLGVCGTQDDVPLLEELITSEDRDSRSALDALIACYLTLKGADGLPLIEERFLKNADAEYTDTYSAIMAIRFHGQEESEIPRERLVAALRHMLDRAELADLVIPDLARWEDWSAMERLVELFKDADEASSWVRVPVINFLRSCPDPRAKEYIDELAKIDPDAVKRASHFFPVTGVAAADNTSTGTGESADAAGEETSEMSEEETGQPTLTQSPEESSETPASEDTEPAMDQDDVTAADSVPVEIAEDDSPSADAEPATVTAETEAAAEAGDATQGEEADEESIASIVPVDSDDSQPTGTAAASVTTRLLVVGVPVLIGGVLFVTFWGLLRANRRPTAT